MLENKIPRSERTFLMSCAEELTRDALEGTFCYEYQHMGSHERVRFMQSDVKVGEIVEFRPDLRIPDFDSLKCTGISASEIYRRQPWSKHFETHYVGNDQAEIKTHRKVPPDLSGTVTLLEVSGTYVPEKFAHIPLSEPGIPKLQHEPDHFVVDYPFVEERYVRVRAFLAPFSKAPAGVAWRKVEANIRFFNVGEGWKPHFQHLVIVGNYPYNSWAVYEENSRRESVHAYLDGWVEGKRHSGSSSDKPWKALERALTEQSSHRVSSAA
jgi:hypothetical protein